jgi:hypothetical protein
MIEAPRDYCPKCGAQDAFMSIPPRYYTYIKDDASREALEWQCYNCRYTKGTNTLEDKRRPVLKFEMQYE